MQYKGESLPVSLAQPDVTTENIRLHPSSHQHHHHYTIDDIDVIFSVHSNCVRKLHFREWISFHTYMIHMHITTGVNQLYVCVYINTVVNQDL